MKGKMQKQGVYGMLLVLLLALSVSMTAPAVAKAAPAKPSVTLTRRTKKSATITIKKKGNVSGYQIFLKTSKKGKFRQIMGIRNQSYTIKGLKPKKTYYVKVRAFKTKGYRITTGKFSKVIKIAPYKKQSDSKVDKEKEDSTLNVPEYAQKVLELVNAERQNAGMEPLVLDAKLVMAAQTRAKELETSFEHIRPDGSSPFTAITESGYGTYMAAGENIAAGQQTPEAVVEAWMSSEGHRANILSADFDKLGVGYCTAEDSYGHYWVQLFVGD